MDSLAKIFVSKGFDKTQPDLYKKIIKYKNLLIEEEANINAGACLSELKNIEIISVIFGL